MAAPVMTRERRTSFDVVNPDGLFAAKTAAYSMGVRDRFISANTSAAAFTVTLPKVSIAAGGIYTVKLSAGAAAGAAPNTCTVTHAGDSRKWQGNVLLRRPGHMVTFISDGEHWLCLSASTGVPVPRAKGFHEMFELPFVTALAADGGPPAATGKHVLLCGSGLALVYNNIVGQTLTGPAWSDPGMDVAMDQTADDGVEVTVPLGANTPHRFIVGTDAAFFCRARMTIVDVSGTDDLLVGFRKREAFQDAVDNYDEMAALNVLSGTINIETILNDGATTTTSTTDTWADAATHTLEVRVSATGVVTYLIDDVAPTTTAAFTFDDAEVVIPFIYALQAADLSGAITVLEWECGYQD